MAQLGKYTLIRKLASGGMAEVHLAATHGPGGFQKTLVVKRIHPHLAEDERFVSMFLDEARLAAMLSHPNVVQIFDFGVAEGRYFLAMELVDGVNLRGLLQAAAERKIALEPRLCARMISLACEGLAYAHDFRDPSSGEPLHLIHRDVSPDNLLLARSGAVKVADFGIARSDTATHRTNEGVVKGKLTYMAPEQLQSGTLTPRTDIHALGVVLYELLTGALPFEGTTEGEIIAALMTGQRVAVTERRADVPPALSSVIHRMTAPNPDERFSNCREVAAALEQFIASSGKQVSTAELGGLVETLVPGPSLSAERAAVRPLQLTTQTAAGASSAAAAGPETGEAFAQTAMRQSNPSLPAFVGEEDEQPWAFEGGPSLSADGTLEGVGHTNAPFELEPTAPAPAAVFRPPEPESMELVERGPRADASPEEMKALDPGLLSEARLRRRRQLFMAGAAVLVIAGVGVLASPGIEAVRTELAIPREPAMTAKLLVIDSEPSGAQVRISGQPVGTTPLAVDNVWPPGEVPVELRLEGYKRWSGHFRGREGERLEIILQR